jgi:CheY-like chemotaxis protein
MGDVLVIEDDREIRNSLNDMLEMEDYKVNVVENGFEALKFLNSTKINPKVILLDIMMPVMDGYEFRKNQLLDVNLAAIPTIVLSADRNCEQNLKNLEVKHFLKKPIDLDLLLKIIAQYAR